MNASVTTKYTKDHEWAGFSGDTVTVGITDHAQSSLGDIVFVELPKVGRNLKKGEAFGVVESIKAVSDLFAPVSGEIISVNTEATSEPSLLNRDPMGAGWLVKIKPSSNDHSELMDEAAYNKLIQSLK